MQKLRGAYESAEHAERQQFIAYSSAVRLSHEKERARVERTKYWSIIASVSGTVFGRLFSFRIMRIFFEGFLLQQFGTFPLHIFSVNHLMYYFLCVPILVDFHTINIRKIPNFLNSRTKKKTRKFVPI